MQSALCAKFVIWLYDIFPSYFRNGRIFVKKKKVTEQKMCVLIFSAPFGLKHVLL
jgi:hypothetical protein